MLRLLLAFSMGMLALGGYTQAATPIDFNRDIKPILSDHCFHCHGPDEHSRQADLRLDQKEEVLRQRDDYWIVKPGRPDASALIDRIATENPDRRMPPPDAPKQLSDKQIELMKQWVTAGADWQEHWSFSVPERPNLPDIKNLSWAHNPIDHFIAQRHEASGLAPQPKADRRTLIRRLSLDLIGLPPTAKQVQDFVDDSSTNAYERLVDRLLASPHYGERMTVEWLDQARYADTNGFSIDGGRHMWLWRDWVIHAYNQNMSFDQFIIEQLAGDLLPEATIDQKVATGFNRNHMITHEGGTIPAENLVNYAADRVRTTAEVFLGLTMGCAQCHDHKYDPISQRDYYRFFAYFNSLEDKGLDGNGGVNSHPKIKATSILGRNETQARRIQERIQSLEQQLKQSLDSQPAWEEQLKRELAELGKDLQIAPADIVKASAPNRNSEFEFRDDGSLLLKKGGGRSPSLVAKINQQTVAGVRLVFSPDVSFPQGGLGYGKSPGLEGSLLLTSFSVSATSTPSEQVDLYNLINIKTATASAAHPNHPAVDSLNPSDATGWSPGANIKTAQHITFQFDPPIQADDTPYLTVMLVWGAGHGLTGGKCRIFTINGKDDHTNIPQDIQEILATAVELRTPEQRERIRSYHATVAPELAGLRYQINNLRERFKHLTEQHEVMVMNTAKKPRVTHILRRGQYDQHGDVVTPGVPATLPQPHGGVSQDRLGLAQWLVQPDHPLTSRVAVNRIWQMIFGRGIVATSADFGSQGARPTHPELLDWLAKEFIDSGWNVKHMLKMLVMSATYQQDSITSPEKNELDPNNQLLSRGPRFRLAAEFIRDSVLQVSGTLVPRIGGPSVRPYQPPNLWREVSHFGSTPATAQIFVQDHGERLYRRSMYTYWKRTVPPPALVSFDAPNRETSTVQRARTNTPLQALAMLNDPQLVEASRNFAERIMLSNSETNARIRFAFAQALARPPSEAELDILRRTLTRELARFRNNPQAAAEYLQYGEAERHAELPIEQHAAWTTVATMIFNLSEMITKG